MDRLSIVHAFQSESTFLVDVPTSILRRPSTTIPRRNRSRVSGNDGAHEAFMSALSLSVDTSQNQSDDNAEKNELSVMRVVPMNGSRAFHRRFLAQCESYCRLCCRLQRGVEWLLSRRPRNHRCITSNATIDDSTAFDVDRLSHLVFPVEPTAFVAAAFALPSIVSVVPASPDEDVSVGVGVGVGGGGDDVGSLKETRVVPYCFFYGFPEQRVLRGQSGSDNTSNDINTNNSFNSALAAESSRMTLMDRFIAVSNATGVCGAASTMHSALGMNNRTRIGLTLAAYLECRLPRSVSGAHRGSSSSTTTTGGVGGNSSSNEWSREDPFSCWSDDVLWRLLGLLVSALAVVHAAGFHFRGELSADDVLCFALPDSSDEDSQTQPISTSPTSTSSTSGTNTIKRHGGMESISHHLTSRTTASESHWLITDTTPAHHAFFMFTTPPRSLFTAEMRGGDEDEEENAAEIGAAQRRDTAALGRILVAVVAEAKRRRGARGATSCSELLFVAERMAAVGEGVSMTTSASAGVLGEAPAHRFAQLQAVQLRTHLWLLRSIVEERDMQLATLMLYHKKNSNSNNNNHNNDNNDNANDINSKNNGSRNGTGIKVTDRKYPSSTSGGETYMAKLEERERLLAEREEKLNQFLLLYELTTERLDQLPAGKESFDRLRRSLLQTPRTKTLSAASALPAAKSLPLPSSSSPSSEVPSLPINHHAAANANANANANATAGVGVGVGIGAGARTSSSTFSSTVPAIPGVAAAAAAAAISTARPTTTTTTTTGTGTGVGATRGLTSSSSTGVTAVPGASAVRTGSSTTPATQQAVQTTSASLQKTSSGLSWSSLAQQPYPRSSRRTLTTEPTSSDKTRPLYGLLRFQKSETSPSSANTNVPPSAADLLTSRSTVNLLGKERRTMDEAMQDCSPRVAPGTLTRRMAAATSSTNTPSRSRSNCITLGNTLSQGTMSSRTPTANCSSVRRQKSVSPVVSSRSYTGRAGSPANVAVSTVSSAAREKVPGRPATSKLSHSASLAVVSSSTKLEQIPSQHVTPVRSHQRTPVASRPTSALASPGVSPLVRTTDDSSSLLLSTSYKTPPRTTSVATPIQSRGSPSVNMWNRAPTPHATTPQSSSKTNVRPSLSSQQQQQQQQGVNLVSVKNVSTTASQPTSTTTKTKPSNYDPSLYMHGSKETGTVAATAAPLPSSLSPSSPAPAPSTTTATTPTGRTISGKKSSEKPQLSGYGGSTKTDERSDTMANMRKLYEERNSSLLMTMNNSRDTPQHHLQERKSGSTATATTPISHAAPTATTNITSTPSPTTNTNINTNIRTNKVRTPGARLPGTTTTTSTNFSSPLGDNNVPITVSLDISADLNRSSHLDSQRPSPGSQHRKQEREENMTPRTARSRLAGDGWVNHHLAALEQLRYDFQQSEAIKSARNTPNGKSGLRSGRERAVDNIEPPKLSPDHTNVESTAAWATRGSIHSSAAAHTSTTSAKFMY